MITVALLAFTVCAFYAGIDWAIDELRETRAEKASRQPVYTPVSHRRKWVCPTGQHRAKISGVSNRASSGSFWHSAPFYSRSPFLTSHSS